ncbi:hypothetical protein DFA_01730 [Cavenderia fasciculata]|uniref:Multiple inositol polyphosphate phosphatase 1 n=1 Tax=Cavenderia fasciculata TaxID=261658 RepID=F4PUC9_CACFS|nr:uncharacterized protein DFA_01730 [Cavenderia fasciculata]EGG21844.1 hypothetical protein DFA_01730 [Cavenderia fasciculata]|eukprot:XP_004359695.1 hypothetical protein DFA_01730 [Cavenderia fasciculata]
MNSNSNIFIQLCCCNIAFVQCRPSSSSSSSTSSSSSSSSSTTSSSSSSSSSEETFNIKQHLSTNTPYWIPEQSKGSPNPPAQCTLQRIDMVARHGSRMPVESSIYDIIDLVQEIKQYSSSIAPQYNWIVNWTVPYPTTDSGLLIFQGELEHYEIAKRMLTRFPDNFPAYSPNTYNTSCTVVSRTCISANSFLYGAFEGTGGLGSSNYQPTFTWTASANEDYLLRFFDTCQTYKDLPVNTQKDQFQANVFPNISTKVAERLGLQDVFDISPSGIATIFSMCAYEISIDNITNQWCSLFDPSDIEAWEYSQDLSNYWRKSYGIPINYQISSLLLQDMVQYFDQFGHAETIIPFVSLLGLYKDDYQITANLSQEQIQSRLFRTSVISPYAANVALLFYDCGDNNYKLRVDHNEIATLIPGCDDIYCDYTIFKQVFSDALTTFSWDKTCAAGDSSDDTPLYRSDKEWKILMSIFVPLSAIVGLLLGLFLPAIFRKVTSDTREYQSLNHNNAGLVKIWTCIVSQS